MSTIDYAVRGTGGDARYGAFEDARRASFSVTGDKEISVNLNPAAVSGYQRFGDDLHVLLTNGKTLVLEGFYVEGATGEKTLFLSENGALVEVVLTDDDGTLLAQYDLVEVGGKWGSFDDLVFLDLELVEPVVAPLFSPLLAGLGAAAAGGAVLLGAGDGGKDDGNNDDVITDDDDANDDDIGKDDSNDDDDDGNNDDDDGDLIVPIAKTTVG